MASTKTTKTAEMSYVLLLLLGLFCCLGESQRIKPCPHAHGSSGYLTIQDIATDIKEEKARVEGGGVPFPSYSYVICPMTTLSFTDEDLPIEPAFNGTFFSCGVDGLEDGCEIRGGTIQFVISEENFVSGSVAQSTVSFQGIVFSRFTRTAIAITGTEEAVGVTIEDCEFSVSSPTTLTPSVRVRSQSHALLSFRISTALL